MHLETALLKNFEIFTWSIGNKKNETWHHLFHFVSESVFFMSPLTYATRHANHSRNIGLTFLPYKPKEKKKAYEVIRLNLYLPQLPEDSKILTDKTSKECNYTWALNCTL